MALAVLFALPTPPTYAETPPVAPASLAINEWMPIAPEGASEADGEWIELVVEARGSLAGFVLTDNDGADDFVFPPLVAEAGEYVLLANRPPGPSDLDSGTRVLFMNKSSWTWENTGDDALLRAPAGAVVDRWSFGTGSAVDVLAPNVTAASDWTFDPPPPGASLAQRVDAVAAARPTPGRENALLEPGPYAGLVAAGLLVAKVPLAVVLCNELERPFEPFGWSFQAGPLSVRIPGGTLGAGECIGISATSAAAARGRIQDEIGATTNWATFEKVPGPNESTALNANDPWGLQQNLVNAGSIRLANLTGPTWWEPCTCEGGWRSQPFTAISAEATAHPIDQLRAAPAGPELGAAVLDMIRGAVSALSVNAYVASDESVIDSLSAAAGRGVHVRLLIEPRPVGWGTQEGGLPNGSRQQLTDAGVEVLAFATGPVHPARDHAKYVTCDAVQFAVLTENFVSSALSGSSPNTGYGLFGYSAGVARDLQRLFDWDWAMAGGTLPPGDADGASAPPTDASTSATTGRVVFSPGGDEVVNTWRDLVDNASERVQVESLSSDEETLGPTSVLGSALLRAASRGVSVSVLLAPGGPGAATAVGASALAAAAALLNASLEVRIDGRDPSSASKMHAKVTVVDGRSLILGSHNLVASAFDANREVSLVVSDVATASWLAARLAADFDRATPVPLPDVALIPGSSLGNASAHRGQQGTLPPTSALLLVGGAGALAIAILPRRRRARPLSTGRPERVAIPEPEDAEEFPSTPPGPEEGPAAPLRPAPFELRVAAVNPQDPPLPPPEVRLPPSALERIHDDER